ncbi:restriction endonuclease [Mesobacillus foraminis]|uniref:restriction endonuclease n=1 Tax=Mesobacillus foraminis TaxID=279826 RepID=UPI000EF46C46|nr:restriction endonuclease [Mesobacillus foraminis]
MSNVIFSPKLIKEGKMTLDGWLETMKSDNRDRLFPNNCFPSEEFLNEYINKINNFSEKEFKNLLRMLVVNTCTYGIDEEHKKMYFMRYKDLEDYPSEYYRRLLETGYAHEGITWVLELLPHSPKLALQGLSAYLAANIMTLPDNAINGLYDVQVLIRARYLKNDYSVDTLLSLDPTEFENLIAKLYKKLGYEVKITPSTRDGGKDVIAEIGTVGRREKLFIECKRYKKNVGVVWARALLGTISNSKVTKGVLIGAKGFSAGTKKLAEQNHRLELIGGIELLTLLDDTLGKNWFDFIPRYISEFK